MMEGASEGHRFSGVSDGSARKQNLREISCPGSMIGSAGVIRISGKLVPYPDAR